MIFYNFTSTGKYTGSYINTTTDITTNPVSGDVAQPSDIIKIEHSLDWSNITTLSFTNLSSELKISNLIESDWTDESKHEWFNSYLKHVGMNSLIDGKYYNELYQIANDNNIFYLISYPSIAYVNQDIVSGEITIGMNVYNMDFLLQTAKVLPHENPLKSIIFDNHLKNEDNSPYKVYISAVSKVTYQGVTKKVWCFGGLEYDYLTDLSTIETGGGNVFGEVKMAGNGIKASYITKKNVDEEDPTLGLVSGEVIQNYCMGDKIYLIDTTVWTKNTGADWTWVGDFSLLDYKWHIADITEPNIDFKASSIDNMLFPVRVLEDYTLGDFGINILSINKHHITTDIIVHIDTPTAWDLYRNVIITDLEKGTSFDGYCGEWQLVARGSDIHAANGSSVSVYLRLRRKKFNNTYPLVLPLKGQIYLR
jgi:hypothetical protein